VVKLSGSLGIVPITDEFLTVAVQLEESAAVRFLPTESAVDLRELPALPVPALGPAAELSAK